MIPFIMRPGNLQLHEVHTLMLVELYHSASVAVLDQSALKDKVDAVLIMNQLADTEDGEFNLHIFEADRKGLAIDSAVNSTRPLLYNFALLAVVA